MAGTESALYGVKLWKCSKNKACVGVKGCESEFRTDSDLMQGYVMFACIHRSDIEEVEMGSKRTKIRYIYVYCDPTQLLYEGSSRTHRTQSVWMV